MLNDSLEHGAPTARAMTSHREDTEVGNGEAVAIAATERSRDRSDRPPTRSGLARRRGADPRRAIEVPSSARLDAAGDRGAVWPVRMARNGHDLRAGSSTRAGGSEEFTDGADPEYEEQILPLVERHLAGTPPGARRRLRRGSGGPAGWPRSASTSSALDPTAAQIVVANERGGGPAYAPAEADGCRAGRGAFDAVVMCLVIEHIDPFEPAIREMARVLEPGGRFLLLLNHPLLQTPGSGWIDDHILEEQYWRVGPYLRDDSTIEEVAPGVEFALHAPPPEPIRTGDGCRSGC